MRSTATADPKVLRTPLRLRAGTGLPLAKGRALSRLESLFNATDTLIPTDAERTCGWYRTWLEVALTGPGAKGDH